MTDIFLSYSREDRQRVSSLVELLESSGFSVWWDRHIHPGEAFEETIDKRILQAKCVVVAWSRTSINSRWVKNEALEGLDRGILVPIMLDEVRVPVAFKQSQTADFTRWPDDVDSEELDLLISAVRDRLGQPDTPLPRRSAQKPIRRQRRGLIATSLVLVLLAAAAAFFWSRPDAGHDVPRIAVLRFSELGTRDRSFLADAISSELFDRLRALDGVRVISQFAAWDIPPQVKRPEVSQRLDADYLVDGELISSDGKSRLRVLIVDHAGEVTWDREYEVTPAGLQHFTQRIADHVLAGLGVEISTADDLKIARYITRSEEAFDLYLRAKDLSRLSEDPNELSEALGYLEQAVTEDSRFVQAFAELCRVNIELYQRSREASRFEGAERACNRTLTLNPSESDAYLALGNLYRVSGQPDAAEPNLLQALAVEPENVDARVALGYLFSETGREAEALAAFSEAIDMQPGYWKSFNARGVHYYEGGKYQRAIADFQQVTRLDPTNSSAFNNLGTARYLNGQFDEAIAAWRKSQAIDPRRGNLSNIGTGYYYLRDYRRAAEMYRSAIESAPEDHRLWGNLADAQRMAGETASAAENYARAIELAGRDVAINDRDPLNLARLAVYHAARGDRREAEDFLAAARAYGGDNPFVLYDVAITLVLLSDLEAARNVYQKLSPAGFPAVILRAEPVFDVLSTGTAALTKPR